MYTSINIVRSYSIASIVAVVLGVPCAKLIEGPFFLALKYFLYLFTTQDFSRN